MVSRKSSTVMRWIVGQASGRMSSATRRQRLLVRCRREAGRRHTPSARRRPSRWRAARTGSAPSPRSTCLVCREASPRRPARRRVRDCRKSAAARRMCAGVVTSSTRAPGGRRAATRSACSVVVVDADSRAISSRGNTEPHEVFAHHLALGSLARAAGRHSARHDDASWSQQPIEPRSFADVQRRVRGLAGESRWQPARRSPRRYRAARWYRRRAPRAHR